MSGWATTYHSLWSAMEKHGRQHSAQSKSKHTRPATHNIISGTTARELRLPPHACRVMKKMGSRTTPAHSPQRFEGVPYGAPLPSPPQRLSVSNSSIRSATRGVSAAAPESWPARGHALTSGLARLEEVEGEQGEQEDDAEEDLAGSKREVAVQPCWGSALDPSPATWLGFVETLHVSDTKARPGPVVGLDARVRGEGSSGAPLGARSTSHAARPTCHCCC